MNGFDKTFLRFAPPPVPLFSLLLPLSFLAPVAPHKLRTCLIEHAQTIWNTATYLRVLFSHFAFLLALFPIGNSQKHKHINEDWNWCHLSYNIHGALYLNSNILTKQLQTFMSPFVIVSVSPACYIRGKKCCFFCVDMLILPSYIMCEIEHFSYLKLEIRRCFFPAFTVILQMIEWHSSRGSCVNESMRINVYDMSKCEW